MRLVINTARGARHWGFWEIWATEGFSSVRLEGPVYVSPSILECSVPRAAHSVCANNLWAQKDHNRCDARTFPPPIYASAAKYNIYKPVSFFTVTRFCSIWSPAFHRRPDQSSLLRSLIVILYFVVIFETSSSEQVTTRIYRSPLLGRAV